MRKNMFFFEEHFVFSGIWETLSSKNQSICWASIRLCIVVRELTWFVLAAQASIWGPEDVFVKRGSTIALTCSINVHATPPGSVLWYHGAAVVDFDSPRGGISLETEKSEAGTTSKLLVTKASLADSGNYTCVPSNANPASVVVHVLNGIYIFVQTHLNYKKLYTQKNSHCLTLNQNSYITVAKLASRKLFSFHFNDIDARAVTTISP